MFRTLLVISVFSLAACQSGKKKQADQPKAPTVPVAKVEKAAPATKPATTKDGLANAKEYTCQVAGDKRVVQFKTSEGRCEIHYTKFGNSEEVAWAEATPQLCSDVFQKIRTNIEGRGFACENAPKGIAAK